MGKRRSAFEEMNRHHILSRAYFFSQKRFRRRFDIVFPFGLCAGLVQVWWHELKSGNDGIRSIHEATSSVIRDVLLSQARSIYLREIPSSCADLTLVERELLAFKYGTVAIDQIKALQTLFGVGDSLELDLVLQHAAPLLSKCAFAGFGPEVIQEMTRSQQPGLRVLLTRTRAFGERGHRMAFAITKTGSYYFYDPSLGEMSFPSIGDFSDWFGDYWKTADWDALLEPGNGDCWSIQLFTLGESLLPAQAARAAELRGPIWDPKSPVDSTSLETLPTRIKNIISLCAD